MTELSRLSERSMDVLKMFKKAKDQASVSKALGIPRSTTVSAISRLRKLGLIECVQVRNIATAHSQLYRITDAGKAEIKLRPRLTPVPTHGGVYSKAVVMNVADDPRNCMVRGEYVPPSMESVRPGADDHRRYASKGKPT